jgi:hypothetical protein
MNTLWHFGDSYGVWIGDTNDPRCAKKGYSEYIADYYNLDLKHFAVSGNSNEIILNSLILQYNNFTEGDFIIINWSFFTRFTYLDDMLRCRSFNDISYNFDMENYDINEVVKKSQVGSKEYLDYLIFHRSEFMREETIVQWNMIINPLLANLVNSGCHVVNSFNDTFMFDTQIFPTRFDNITIPIDSYIVKHPNIKLNWNDSSSNFVGEYVHFIKANGYERDGEDGHYKFGVQEQLSNEWIKRINSQILTKL